MYWQLFSLASILSIFFYCGCHKDKVVDNRIWGTTVLTPFYGNNNTPGLYGWHVGEKTDTFPLVNIGPFPGNRWSLSLNKNESVWYFLDSLEGGVYRFKAFIKTLNPAKDSSSGGKAVIHSASEVKNILFDRDTEWHFISQYDTLSPGPAKIFLYGGTGSEKILINRVSFFSMYKP